MQPLPILLEPKWLQVCIYIYEDVVYIYMACLWRGSTCQQVLRAKHLLTTSVFQHWFPVAVVVVAVVVVVVVVVVSSGSSSSSRSSSSS